MDRRSFIRSVVGALASSAMPSPNILAVANKVANSDRVLVTFWANSIEGDRHIDQCLGSIQKAINFIKKIGLVPSHTQHDGYSGSFGVGGSIDSRNLPRLLAAMKQSGMEVDYNEEAEWNDFHNYFADAIVPGEVNATLTYNSRHETGYGGDISSARSMVELMQQAAQFWNDNRFWASPRMAAELQQKYNIKVNDSDEDEREQDEQEHEQEHEQNDDVNPNQHDLSRWVDDGGRINENAIRLIASLLTEDPDIFCS